MQHFLASRQMVDIPIKHLFVEYRHWIERKRPFANVAAELAAISRQGDDFRRLLEPQPGDVIHRLATFLDDFDISTAYPLLLYLLDAGVSEAEWKSIATALESYLLRRAVLGWTTKAYNRIFLTLIKTLRAAGATAAALRTALSNLTGESSSWPTDAQFAEAWESRPAYEQLNNAKVVHILKRVSDRYQTKLNEQVLIAGPLTVEHILPQNWTEHWPLPDGSTGLTVAELWDAEDDDARAVSTRRREAFVHTFGNLTILTQQLNSVVSNAAWPKKRPELLKASLLPINQQLHSYPGWDEETIQKRGRELCSN
jgi:hypothetical protein